MPGTGLLLLRTTIGLTAMVEGGAYLNEGANATFGVAVVGLLAVASGVFLLIGFLTPVACVLVGLGSAGIALSWLPVPTLNFFDARLTTCIVVAIAIALIFLGPGAFSLDCRLFGRREIVIPTDHSPK
ncbi:MAG: hypothetical protein DMG06_16945 [Acidobacteria bacterium]|nr:MAG: hypothetical protein DMG06_16945 [Acidobacteriota bacterium]